MIQIKLRKNLLYLLAYYISWYLRKINGIIFINTFDYYPTYIFLYLMTLGEIVGGLSIYLYQYYTLKQKKTIKFFGMKKIYGKEEVEQEEITVGDKKYKRAFLIFLASFFDFMEFIIANFHVPFFDKNISSTIDSRFGCISTIISSLICIYALRIRIVKHHKISLIFMSICLCVAFILEIIYRHDQINIGKLIISRILVCCYLTSVSFTDCTEKYLVDVNFINPFKILMYEGIFVFIMALFLSIGKDPFKDIIIQYKTNNIGTFFLLLFFLFLHLVLSAFVNSYKIYCNVIYSPMARSLMDYFMGPFFIIYFFIKENDFNKDYSYFFISLFLSLIVDFFSCVYNEYIIIFCCGLEHNTKDIIIERSSLLVNNPTDSLIKDFEEEQNFESDNSETRSENELV